MNTLLNPLQRNVARRCESIYVEKNLKYFRLKILRTSALRANIDLVSKLLFDKLNCGFNYSGYKNESPWTEVGVGCGYGISLNEMENPNGN